MPFPRPDLVLADVRSTSPWSSTGPAPSPAPPGYGRVVLLVPGLLSPNGALRRLAAWLRASGWTPVTAEVGINVRCSQRAVDALAERAEQAYDATGERVVVVGHSRGGLHAKVLAVTRPDLVAAVVTLGSPLAGYQSLHRHTRYGVRALIGLNRRGAPTLSQECWDGTGCCAGYTAALAAPMPAGIPFVSVYTPLDHVVEPDACLDPGAEHVEVHTSHQGMVVSRAAWQALARVLRDLP